MSNTLRSKVIRLAHQNPELRPHLLPLLKTAGADPVQFRKNPIGYEVTANGDRYLVVSDTYQTGLAKERKQMVDWRAFDAESKKDVAKATSLAALKLRLSNYIADKAAGSLKSGMSAAAKYGVEP